MSEIDDEIKLPENSPFESLLVNEKYVTIGECIVTAKKLVDEQGKISLQFDGFVKMPLYEQEILTIETRRYIIAGIDVYEEKYNSKEEDIEYRFTCNYFRTKYQTDMFDELDNVLNYDSVKNNSAGK